MGFTGTSNTCNSYDMSNARMMWVLNTVYASFRATHPAVCSPLPIAWVRSGAAAETGSETRSTTRPSASEHISPKSGHEEDPKIESSASL